MTRRQPPSRPSIESQLIRDSPTATAPADCRSKPGIYRIPPYMSTFSLSRKLCMSRDNCERRVAGDELDCDCVPVLGVAGITRDVESFGLGLAGTIIKIVGGGNADFDAGRPHFEDGALDCAVSLDLLEHIQPGDQATRIDERFRVARRQAISCRRLGTEDPIDAEREVAGRYRKLTGQGHRFLEVQPKKGSNQIFMTESRLAANSGFRSAAAYVRHRPDVRHSTTLSTEASPVTNRAFIEFTPSGDSRRQSGN